MSIRILDDSTVNKIAAGEVIERPSSVLKELLENSSDSGATQIEVDFEQGGKLFLGITDNGSGISREDLPLAVARHATSKLQCVEDLAKIQTFGFRGEALASIASVSKMTIHTGRAGSPEGSVLTSHGGQSLEGVKPAPPLSGTTVQVRELFFNVPARLKFLKSIAAETGSIKKVFKSFALSHPHVTLVLRQNQKILFHWGPREFLKRTAQVLEIPETDLLEVKREEPGLKLQACLARPELNIPSQQGIWIFVQDRPVVDKSIQFAIMEGYRNLTMHKEYPQVVLQLEVDPSEIDINVHPTKERVKFFDNGRIFRFVSSSIREALSLMNVPTSEVLLGENFVEAENGKLDSYWQSGPVQESFVQEAVTQYNARSWNQDVEPLADTSSRAVESSPRFSSLHLIGQLSNTYLVCQNAQALVLVDQHAAHERILFERLKASYAGGSVQSQLSLLEEIIELPAEIVEALLTKESMEFFETLGFEFFQRGQTAIKISSRPSFLEAVSLKPLFEKMGEDLLELNTSNIFENIRGDIWASMACHGAIRAGRVLSQEEMKSLLAQMDEFTFSNFCPHGRPASVKITVFELEKMFKRIV